MISLFVQKHPVSLIDIDTTTFNNHMQNFKLWLSDISWGWPTLIKFIKLRYKSNKMHKWFVNDFMQQEDQAYLSTYLTNIGFKVHNVSRALVAQTKMPQEVYDAMGGRQNEFEEVDIIGVMSYVMHERLQGVTVQLEKHNLLDIITLKNIYIGNGVIATIMSNIYESQLQEELEEHYVGAVIAGAIVDVAILSALLYQASQFLTSCF